MSILFKLYQTLLTSVLLQAQAFDVEEMLAQRPIKYLAQYVSPYVILTAFLVLFFVLGALVEKLLLPWLKKLARRTPWLTGDYLISILKRRLSFGVMLVGGFIGLALIPLDEKSKDLAVKSLNVVMIAYFTFWASAIAITLFELYLRHMDPEAERLPSSSIIKNIIKVIILILGMLMVFNSLGISITPILTALGVGGLAVALALQETLGNLFTGLQLVATGKVKPGDYIYLDSGDEGYVLDISWRNTTLRTIFNTVIVIPNTKLGSSIMTNYMQEGKHIIITVENGVAYGSDLYKVEKVTTEVAEWCQKEVEGGVRNYKPFMRFHTFGDSNINFTVRLCIHEFRNKFLMEHKFVQKLHQRFMEEDIEISWPVRVVHHRDLPGNTNRLASKEEQKQEDS